MNAGGRRGPAMRGPLLLARASTPSMVVLALAQATLAGNFLGGQYDALMLHSLGAKAITLTSAVQVAILAWIWRLGGPRGAFLGGIAQTLLLVAEFAAGELRLTAVHVPLGVLLVVGIVQVATVIWRTPLPARRAVDGEVAS
ncbi:hypothetical protein [Mycobacterium intracellulare]|nr:hypothetical protein [Mycobacterium intracellulare]MCA2310589.1 hypothetical protein [Mycobacterium intracellulare subsp. chimaera]MCA2353353.1 hypothetical protein [Mycobacterium intracellulare subsp. chimaera]MCV7328146.1 hypothetical protein [Mycobacterium intracellulare subsp. chimaera]